MYRAMLIAERIAQNGQLALCAIKRAVTESIGRSLSDGYAL